MRISDWSSDVCSSDLLQQERLHFADDRRLQVAFLQSVPQPQEVEDVGVAHEDRKSVVSGKSVSVRVDLVGRRIIKTKNKYEFTYMSEIGIQYDIHNIAVTT